MAKQIVNSQTGEIVVLRGSAAIVPTPSAISEVSSIQNVTGKNSKAINLKDHPEYSGKIAQFEKVIWKKKHGKLKEDENPLYFLAHTFIFEKGREPVREDYVKLMTGANFIVERLQDAELAMEDGSPYPLRGILRKSADGDSWYLEDME